MVNLYARVCVECGGVGWGCEGVLGQMAAPSLRTGRRRGPYDRVEVFEM